MSKRVVMTGLFLLTMVLPWWMESAETTPYRILFVHSGSSFSRRTQELCFAFVRSLEERGIRAEYQIHVLASQPRRAIEVSAGDLEPLQRRLQDFSYDLLLVCSNDVVHLLYDGRIKLPPQMPVLAISFLGCMPDRVGQTLNLTGVEVPSSVAGNLELAQRILGEPDSILIVSSASDDGNAQTEAAFVRIPDELLDKVRFINGKDYSSKDLQAIARGLTDRSLILFLSWFSPKDSLWEDSFSTLEKLSQVTPALILGQFHSYTAVGAHGGYGVSLAEQGRTAARLAVRILQGESPRNIAPVRMPLRGVLNDQICRQYRISPAQFRDLVLLNIQPPVWQLYQKKLMWGGVLLGVLLALAGLFGYYRYRERRRQEEILSSLGSQIGVVDRSGRVLFCREPGDAGLPRWEKLDDLSDEARDLFTATVHAVFADGVARKIQFNSLGREYSARFTLLPRRNAYCRPVVMWEAIDLTEMMHEHRLTRQLAGRLRLTLESIGDAVIVVDARGRIAIVNPVALRLLGMEKRDLLGKPFDQRIRLRSPHAEDKVASPVSRALAERQNIELGEPLELLDESGGPHPVAGNVAPIIDDTGRLAGAVVVLRDIAEVCRKNARIERQEQLLKLAIKSSRLHFFIYRDGSSPLLSFCGEEPLWGLRPDGSPLSGAEWVAPEDYPDFKAQWSAMFAGHRNRIECAYRSGRPGAYRYFELRAEILALPDVGERTVTGVIWEVTRLERMRHQLRDANLIFQEVMAHLDCYVYLKSAERDFRYVFCNRRMGHYFNRPLAEIIGHTDFEIVAPELAERFRANDRQLIASGQEQIFYEEIADAEKGRRRVRLLKCCFRSSTGEMLILGLGIDITEWNDMAGAGRDYFQASENS